MRDIIEKILDECLLEDFRKSSDMIEDGLIDSFDMIQILTSLETEFDIEINMSDIERADLKNVEAIENLIQRVKNEN